MTREELIAWANDQRPFDGITWVGANISVADVKAAVREIAEVGHRPKVKQRGVDFPCEDCGALAGNVLQNGWYRCKQCGYPGQ